MNNGKILLLFVGLMLLFAHSSKTQAIQVLERKIISTQATDCDMHQTKLIFDGHNNVLISMYRLLYTNDNLIKMNVPGEYCCRFLGGFVKDDRFYVAFQDINTVDVYSVQKQIELVSYIKSLDDPRYPYYDGVVTIPEQNNSYYLFGHYRILPFNPIENVRMIASAGHGVVYDKPLLAEIQNNKIVRCIKLDYGGKRDESYVVEKAVGEKDSIHFFGFRNIDVPFIGTWGPIQLVKPGEGGYGQKMHNFDRGDYYEDRDITQSVILYYSDYNLKKEKNIRKHTIYQNTPGYDKKTDTYSDYGVLSVDAKEGDVFAVFSWVKWQRHHAGSTMVEGQGLKHKEGFNLNDVTSDVYYWQCSDKSYGKAEKIAEGFCPLVRVDILGDAHIFWLDHSGNIVQKVRKDGKWRNEEIILSGVSASPAIIYTKYCSSVRDEDRPEAILYTKFFAAEFDKDNNLHAIYPTAEGVVYTKLKLE